MFLTPGRSTVWSLNVGRLDAARFHVVLDVFGQADEREPKPAPPFCGCMGASSHFAGTGVARPDAGLARAVKPLSCAGHHLVGLAADGLRTGLHSRCCKSASAESSDSCPKAARCRCRGRRVPRTSARPERWRLRRPSDAKRMMRRVIDDLFGLGVARDRQRVFGEQRQERIGGVVARAFFGEREQALVEAGVLAVPLPARRGGGSCASAARSARRDGGADAQKQHEAAQQQAGGRERRPSGAPRLPASEPAPRRDCRGAPRPREHPEAALQTIQILSKAFEWIHAASLPAANFRRSYAGCPKPIPRPPAPRAMPAPTTRVPRCRHAYCSGSTSNPKPDFGGYSCILPQIQRVRGP
jgi:hypothetical protein